MTCSAPAKWFGRFSLLLVALLALLGAWPRSVRADGCKRDGQQCVTNMSCCSRDCFNPAPRPGKPRPLFGTCCTPTSCTAQFPKCGMIPDGDCGDMLTCGCPAGQTCSAGVCVTTTTSTTTSTSTTTTTTSSTTTTTMASCSFTNSTVTLTAIDDETGSTASGNFITQSGAVDSDGDTLSVSSVSFDAATSVPSSGLTATLDTSTAGHTLIHVYNGTVQDAAHLVGALDVILSTGAYTYTNGVGAQGLPVGTNTIEFRFNITDGSATCMLTGELNVTVTGDDACSITLTSSSLSNRVTTGGFPATGNLITDSGAKDSDGDTLQIGSVSFDAATSDTGVTAGAPDTTTVPGHELINVYNGTPQDAAHQLGTLDVTLSTGAYTYTTGFTTVGGTFSVEFMFTLNDGSGSDDCTATGTLDIMETVS